MSGERERAAGQKTFFSEQDLPVVFAGFEGRDLKVRTDFWTGPKVFLDGLRIKRQKGVYPVRTNAGQEVSLRLKGRLLDPIPDVEIGGRSVSLAPTMRWHEYLVVCLPFTLVFIGGAVGAMVGAAGAYMNAKIVRSPLNTVLRYGLAVLVALVVALAYVDLADRVGRLTGMFRPIAERIGDKRNYSGQKSHRPARVPVAPRVSAASTLLMSRTWVVGQVLLKGSPQSPNLLLEARRRFQDDGSFSQVYRDGSESRGNWRLADNDTRVVLTVGDDEYSADIIELSDRTLKMKTGDYEIIHVSEQG